MASSSPDTTDWLICTACGTQFPTADRTRLTTCFICDDPRQFTPPSGQSFTTLAELSSSGFQNNFAPYAKDERITFIYTTPKVGIGQRCALIKTPAGNILWDCITFLDGPTIAQINALGGIQAIVISHPHYYSTHLLWARTFDCNVYLASEDRQWLAQQDEARQVLLGPDETEKDIFLMTTTTTSSSSSGSNNKNNTGAVSTGVKALKLGGHFPGSMVLLFDGRLLIADTLVTTPSGLGSWETDATGAKRTTEEQQHLGRPQGMNSFVFMWSIPNMIPLPPDKIAAMWRILERHEFRSTHGAFMGQDMEDEEIRKRVLESMQIQIRAMGWSGHEMLGVKA